MSVAPHFAARVCTGCAQVVHYGEPHECPPPGAALTSYQRRLALEQRRAAERKRSKS